MKISVVVPCYNEQDNVKEMAKALINIFDEKLSIYEREIIFIDNDSTDLTRTYLREICSEYKDIKAIFNAKNFGQFNSPYYGILQTTGDCTVVISCDFQDPVELIPVFVKEWENGYKIVSAIKTASKENKLIRFFRNCYYKLIGKMSEVEQIENFTGFGLYDKSFVDVLRDLKDPTPFLRGIVAELGFSRKDVAYTQQKREKGKTHNNFFSLYDAAMLSFTSYTKNGLRCMSFIGMFVCIISILIAVVYLVMKLTRWDEFDAGVMPVLLAVLIFGSIILFFMGIMGEYILSINKRIMNRPLVVEEERINFEKEDGDKQNLKHVGIYVSMMDKMETFYSNCFNLKKIVDKIDKNEMLDDLLKKQHVHIQTVKLITEYGVSTKNGEMLELIKVLDKKEEFLPDNRSIDLIGMNHISFGVKNMQSTIEKVIQNGGKIVTQIYTLGENQCCFVTDPEGNYIEIISKGKK